MRMQNGDYNADVVIVGGGIAGCIKGWKLAESGASVIIIEAGDRLDRNKSILAYMNVCRCYEVRHECITVRDFQHKRPT